MIVTDLAYEEFYTGQRMRINLPEGMDAHEVNDTGGIVYFTDGQRVSWRYDDKRKTCPDWGLLHDFPQLGCGLIEVGHDQD